VYLYKTNPKGKPGLQEVSPYLRRLHEDDHRGFFAIPRTLGLTPLFLIKPAFFLFKRKKEGWETNPKVAKQ